MITGNAAAIVVLASVVVCLTGLVQVCECDPDPDGCGQTCHVCVDAPSLPRLSCSVGTAGRPSPCGGLFAPCGHEGEPCGACLTERGGADVCRHVALTLGDVWAPSAPVALPAVAAVDPIWYARAARAPHPLRLRPVSTGLTWGQTPARILTWGQNPARISVMRFTAFRSSSLRS